MAMDPFTRRLVEEAERIDDIARDRSDRFERKWAQREARLAAGDIHEWQTPETQTTKHTTREVIYKTHEPKPEPQQQQQAAATIDDDAWNTWLRKSVMRIMDEVVVPIIAEETRKMLDDEIIKLHAEIGVLRSDIEVMRSVMSGKTVEMKRDRDAA